LDAWPQAYEEPFLDRAAVDIHCVVLNVGVICSICAASTVYTP